MSHFEIEVKSLLGEEKNAEDLKKKMLEYDPACTQVASSSQLNHYFKDGDVARLYQEVEPLFSDEQREKLKKIIERGADFSVRTRQSDGVVLLVVKASIDEGDSANTIKRMEFEEVVSCTLEELDSMVLKAGFVYQAKWSRERQEFSYKGANVCLDKNAGYGYLAEFEKIVHDEDEADLVRQEIDALMTELGVEELSQERLARMFAYYNEHWPEYYGSNRTFTIE